MRWPPIPGSWVVGGAEPDLLDANELDANDVDAFDLALKAEDKHRVDVLVGEEPRCHESRRASSLARSPSGG